MGASGGALSGVVGVLEDLYAPGAARARELMDAEHQVAIPVPSPGDRMLSTGRLVVRTRPGRPPEAGPAA